MGAVFAKRSKIKETLLTRSKETGLGRVVQDKWNFYDDYLDVLESRIQPDILAIDKYRCFLISESLCTAPVPLIRWKRKFSRVDFHCMLYKLALTPVFFCGECFFVNDKVEKV